MLSRCTTRDELKLSWLSESKSGIKEHINISVQNVVVRCPQMMSATVTDSRKKHFNTQLLEKSDIRNIEHISLYPMGYISSINNGTVSENRGSEAVL